MEVNHGLILDEIILGNHHVVGGYGDTDRIPLVLDHNWVPFLPKVFEYQNVNGIDPLACTNFSFELALKTLMKRHGFPEKDLSVRWFAKKSGTSVERGGNSPHQVAEFARTKGIVLERDWPFDSEVDSLEEFYAEPPLQLDVKAKELLTLMEIRHRWIEPPTADALFAELQYSPLGFTSAAWFQDENGLYYRPDGMRDTHMTTCVGAEYGKYWLIADSYADNGQPFKKLRWDHLPKQAKSYSIRQRSESEMKVDLSILQVMRDLYDFIINILMKEEKMQTPEVKPAPEPPKKVESDRLLKFCQAIEFVEDWVPPGGKFRSGKIAPTGSVSYRNNNPGNCRNIKGEFIKFKTKDEGFAYLMDYVKRAATDKHAAYVRKAKDLGLKTSGDLSILNFFQVYAPAEDSNHPQSYAQTVAMRVGVFPTTKLSELLA